MAGGGGNEPNLTPFIDLFSVLVCFLLMTAAWLQLESLNTNIEKSTSSEAPDQSPPPPPDKKKVQLQVTLEASQIIFKEDEHSTKVANAPAGGMDKPRVKQMLEHWKKRFPDRKDIVVNTETGVLYGSLISMYDMLIVTGWPDVGINPQ